MWKFNVITKEWLEMKPNGDIPHGRYGHTCVLSNNKLYMFGGGKKYNVQIKARECLSDVKSYDILTDTWNNIKTYTNGDLIANRRCHSAIIFNKQMLVYGGINEFGKILDDCWVLSLDNNN